MRAGCVSMAAYTAPSTTLSLPGCDVPVLFQAAAHFLPFIPHIAVRPYAIHVLHVYAFADATVPVWVLFICATCAFGRRLAVHVRVCLLLAQVRRPPGRAATLHARRVGLHYLPSAGFGFLAGLYFRLSCVLLRF